MVIYGVALLSFCMLVGVLVGDVLGDLIGVQANVGGVGIAMLLLIILSNLSSHRFCKQFVQHADGQCSRKLRRPHVYVRVGIATVLFGGQQLAIRMLDKLIVEMSVKIEIHIDADRIS